MQIPRIRHVMAARFHHIVLPRVVPADRMRPDRARERRQAAGVDARNEQAGGDEAAKGRQVSTTQSTRDEFLEVQRQPEFAFLRAQVRGTILRLGSVFSVWFLLHIALAGWVPELLAVRIIGNFNIGMLLIASQFVLMFAITATYTRYARRAIDPRADGLRAEFDRKRI